ncbi:MAG: Rpn family recombination-promoting nuclease/putative transposase [Blastocatellia bacterium]
MSEIKNPHDAFFKQLFARPGVAPEFLENYLPAHLTATLDLDSIELVEGSFIDEELQEHLSDMIFRVRLKRGGQAFIYILFEHKSEADRWAPWQALRYIMRMWEKEKAAGVEKFTPVLPIVFYHGRARWKFGAEFSELIEFAGFDELREYAPGYRVHLVDLSQYADEQVVGSRLLRFGLMLLKYIFRRRELNARVDEIFEIYRPLFSGSPWDFLFVAVKYLMSVSPPPLPRERLREAVVKVFAEQEGVIMQTLAEEILEEFKQKFEPQIQQLAMQKLEQELRQEVRQEEAVTLALRMLDSRLGSIDASTEKRIRELSIAQLEDLVVAAADFRTSKDLQGWLRAQGGAEKA